MCERLCVVAGDYKPGWLSLLKAHYTWSDVSILVSYGRHRPNIIYYNIVPAVMTVFRDVNVFVCTNSVIIIWI